MLNTVGLQQQAPAAKGTTHCVGLYTSQLEFPQSEGSCCDLRPSFTKACVQYCTYRLHRTVLQYSPQFVQPISGSRSRHVVRQCTAASRQTELESRRLKSVVLHIPRHYKLLRDILHHNKRKLEHRSIFVRTYGRKSEHKEGEKSFPHPYTAGQHGSTYRQLLIFFFVSSRSFYAIVCASCRYENRQQPSQWPSGAAALIETFQFVFIRRHLWAAPIPAIRASCAR